MKNLVNILAIAGVVLSTSLIAAFGQAALVPFGQAGHDTTQAVEIVADSFTVNQNRGSAEFVGNVVVGQGDLRLSAGKIEVEYATASNDDGRLIGRLIASGGITLVSNGQAAEAETATYSIDVGTIVLEGNVLITQGANALAGQKITISLTDGSAKVEGRVKTIFQTGVSE
ncbi:MAG: lipopolysaccharide export system protein LptA [Paracoccaceae bacterium]|jgi:lipopolysaccharide export system protein LptA